MKTWSFYDPATGAFSGRRFKGPKSAVAANTPPGLVAIEGRFNRAQIVDLQTGQVVEGAQDAHVAVDAAMRRIGELERRQLRPLRELSVDPDNAEARSRLLEIDRKITALRRQFSV